MVLTCKRQTHYKVIFCRLTLMKTTIINIVIALGTIIILWTDYLPDYLAIAFLSFALLYRLVQITTKGKS